LARAAARDKLDPKSWQWKKFPPGTIFGGADDIDRYGAVGAPTSLDLKTHCTSDYRTYYTAFLAQRVYASENYDTASILPMNWPLCVLGGLAKGIHRAPSKHGKKSITSAWRDSVHALDIRLLPFPQSKWMNSWKLAATKAALLVDQIAIYDVHACKYNLKPSFKHMASTAFKPGTAIAEKMLQLLWVVETKRGAKAFPSALKPATDTSKKQKTMRSFFGSR
jgi:hypothetical protein